MLFIWVEKECMKEVIDKFDGNDFQYVENMVWVKLDPAKEEGNGLNTYRGESSKRE